MFALIGCIFIGCIFSMNVYAAGMPFPRWVAPACGRAVDHVVPDITLQPSNSFDAIGPVESIVQKIIVNPFAPYGYDYQLKYQAKYTFHGNGRPKSYSHYSFSKNGSLELKLREKYDERGVIVESCGSDDRCDDIVVDTEMWTVTTQGRRRRETIRYTEGFVRIIGKTTKWVNAELVYEYSYDTLGRLTMICIVTDGKRILRKTVFYDGARREFDTDYYVKYKGSPRRSVTGYSEIDILDGDTRIYLIPGHEEIEIFDNDIRVYLVRRRRLTGDRLDPDTIEKAEAEVETIEYLFDSHGNEIRQTNYLDGVEYIYFNTKYNEFDRFNNWLHRLTTVSTRDGKEKQYSEETRQITYFE